MELTTISHTIRGIFTWEVNILSSGLYLCNAAITSSVILVFMFELFRVLFLFSSFLLFWYSDLFFCFRHSCISFRIPGFFLIFPFLNQEQPCHIRDINDIAQLGLTRLDLISMWNIFLLIVTIVFGLVSVLARSSWFLCQGSLLQWGSFHYYCICRNLLPITSSDFL